LKETTNIIQILQLVGTKYLLTNTPTTRCTSKHHIMLLQPLKDNSITWS
jgi:hypothetical protein